MTQPWYEIANEAEVPSPALLVYPDRIAANIDRTIALAGGAGRLRPHVKTHKVAEVVRMQLDRGICKFKAATIAEAEMAAAAGAKDVLLAYPAVGPTAARLCTLATLFPQTRFRTLADCDAGIDGLARAAAAAGIAIDVLLDLNVGMNRTGILPGLEAARLYRRLATTPGLTAGGLHAYDGHLHDSDHARLGAAAATAFAPVWQLRDALVAARLAVPRVVASGTPTFPILAARGDVEVGTGTTVLWDAGQLVTSPDLDFLHAAVLLARVVSRPAAGRLCLDLGHKAVASEMPHPRVTIFGLEDAACVGHSEEHMVLETPRAEAWPVGTVVYALPWHVCPTVALHDEVVVVRAGRAVERWPVAARRRRITV